MRGGSVPGRAGRRLEADVDTVVLDLGQVLVDWDPRRAHPELDAVAWDAVAAEIGFGALNLRADAGERWSDLDAEVAATWPQHAGFLLRYRDGFAATLVGPVPGMPELVGRLAADGVRLLGLSNWSRETYPHGPAAVPAIDLLEAVVVSGHVGVVKPDPAIYQHLVSTHGVDPGRTLFVDDRAENVGAARALGFHGHVFTRTELLRAHLHDLGLGPVPGAAPRESRPL